MSDATVQMMVAVFADEPAAKLALKDLRQVKQGINGAMLIVTDETGRKIHYKDVGFTPAKGALGGVILGAAVGVLTGGTGLVLGAAGAALGGLTGKKKQDSRFDANQLNQIATSLPPGGAAIVIVVQPDCIEPITAALEQHRADWLIADISADLAEQLQAHREKAQLLLEQNLRPDA